MFWLEPLYRRIMSYQTVPIFDRSEAPMASSIEEQRFQVPLWQNVKMLLVCGRSKMEMV